MSDCIDNDLEFHGTKKGGRRKTARPAYTGLTKGKIISYIDLAIMRIKQNRTYDAESALLNLKAEL